MPTYRDSIQDKGFGRTKQYTETGKSAGKEQFVQKKLHVIEWKIYPRNKKEVSRGFITCYKLQWKGNKMLILKDLMKWRPRIAYSVSFGTSEKQLKLLVAISPANFVNDSSAAFL